MRIAAPLTLCLLVACSSDTSAPDASDLDASDVAPSDVRADDTEADAAADAEADAAVEDTCDADGWGPAREFDDVGPFGAQRHDVAADFTLPLIGQADWTLSEAWSGCDSYVFLPDTLVVSQSEPTSLWEDGVAGLIAASPPNVHYFFLSRRSGDAATQAVTAMRQRLNLFLDEADPATRARWETRLHVVAAPAGELDAWVGASVQSGAGALGLTIDRRQRVRAVGSLADPTRRVADEFPFGGRLALAANEPRYYNFEVRRDRALAAVDATEVVVWDGEVIEHFHDVEVTLPSAAEMAAFDTLEFDFTQRCPDPVAIEAGNCGAWDYLAHLWLFVGDGDDAERIELARHITTYHREGRWIVDITPALHSLREGGTRRLRWEWAPSWNTQPTATWLTLRFSNQGKGERPIAITPLWEGGPFNASYNDGRDPIDVPIPADATRVELRTIITGHGIEASQCAEFCNHEHEFIVGGRSIYVDSFDRIGNEFDCMERVDEGVVPNQWGTWWFGRGGWCPGQQVDPFIADVTDYATPGEDLRVEYTATLNRQPPPDGAGNIVMNAFVVSYGPSGSVPR